MPCAINTFNICVDAMYTIHIVLEFRLNCAKCNKNIILGFADLIGFILFLYYFNQDHFEMHFVHFIPAKHFKRSWRRVKRSCIMLKETPGGKSPTSGRGRVFHRIFLSGKTVQHLILLNIVSTVIWSADDGEFSTEPHQCSL